MEELTPNKERKKVFSNMPVVGFGNSKSIKDYLVQEAHRFEIIFDNWKPFKSDEKSFLFHPESSFCSHITKRLGKKNKVNFKFYEVTT